MNAVQDLPWHLAAAGLMAALARLVNMKSKMES
jgi:hypothetical protein